MYWIIFYSAEVPWCQTVGDVTEVHSWVYFQKFWKSEFATSWCFLWKSFSAISPILILDWSKWVKDQNDHSVMYILSAAAAEGTFCWKLTVWVIYLLNCPQSVWIKRSNWSQNHILTYSFFLCCDCAVCQGLNYTLEDQLMSDQELNGTWFQFLLYLEDIQKGKND